MRLLPRHPPTRGRSIGCSVSLLAISLLVLALVLGLMLLYVVRYRARQRLDRGDVGAKTWRIEVVWTAATLWRFSACSSGGRICSCACTQPQPDPLTINVIGKQWMWKVEYPGGQREINALHLPIGRDVQLLLTSEDVIHDFGLPAFRVKHDVLPGRYEALWLQRRPARHLPSVLRPVLRHRSRRHGRRGHRHARTRLPEMAGANGARPRPGGRGPCAVHASMAAAAATRTGLSGGGGTVRAPSLNGLYSSPVPLADGSTVIADDRYIHDSILYPQQQIVASYAPVMPSFDGVIGEEDLVKIIAYIKSLAPRVAQASAP